MIYMLADGERICRSQNDSSFSFLFVSLKSSAIADEGALFFIFKRISRFYYSCTKLIKVLAQTDNSHKNKYIV